MQPFPGHTHGHEEHHAQHVRPLCAEVWVLGSRACHGTVRWAGLPRPIRPLLAGHVRARVIKCVLVLYNFITEADAYLSIINLSPSVPYRDGTVPLCTVPLFIYCNIGVVNVCYFY